MNAPAPDENFVRQLTGVQSRLLAFIMSLLGNWEAAQDILQETNIVIWRKASQYTPGTNFMAWACEVARYEVLTWVRDQRRDRLLFDADLIELVAVDAVRKANNTNKLSLFLDQCLALCSDRDRDLIQQRYASGGSVKAIAAERNEPAGRIAVVLCRIRRNLMACVQRKLAAEAGS